MSRRILFAFIVSLSLLTYSSFMPETSATAQTRKRSSRRQSGNKPKQPAPAQKDAPADPYAEQRKTVSTAIETACKKLEETIKKANAAPARKPFYSLTPDKYFQDRCKADGTLAWRAVRIGGTGGDPSDTQSALWVIVKVTDLELGALTPDGSEVEFSTKEEQVRLAGSSTVEGDAEDSDEYVKNWTIKLRENDLAKEFRDQIVKLIASLEERDKLPPIARLPHADERHVSAFAMP